MEYSQKLNLTRQLPSANLHKNQTPALTVALGDQPRYFDASFCDSED
jgi:hypothetical protein